VPESPPIRVVQAGMGGWGRGWMDVVASEAAVEPVGYVDPSAAARNAILATGAPQSTLYSNASTSVPTSGTLMEPSGLPFCQSVLDTTVWSCDAGAYGPGSTSQPVEAAEAWEGAMTSAVKRVRRNMRIRGLTTPVIGSAPRSCSV